MANFLVGYDKHEGEDYSELEQVLKAYGTWWHNLDSTWLIKSSATAVQVRDGLIRHLDAADKLLVIDVSGDAAAWWGFDDSASKWLKENL